MEVNHKKAGMISRQKSYQKWQNWLDKEDLKWKRKMKPKDWQSKN